MAYLASSPGVVRRAAGDDEDLVDLAQFLVGEALLVEHDAPVDEVPEQGVGDRGGLLGDLLEHEVLVAALLGGRQVPVDVERPGSGVVAVAVEVGDRVAVGGDHDGLVLAELDGVAGVLDEGRDVGAEEHLAVADADHQRRGAPGRDDGARVVGVGEHQREVALEARQHRHHRADEVARGRSVVVLPGHQVHGDLGVGVAGELDAGGLQLGAQRGEVLDDPVVDDGDLARGVAVRVGVAVGRPAVGGPPGVAHAGGAGQPRRSRPRRAPPRGWPAGRRAGGPPCRRGRRAARRPTES